MVSWAVTEFLIASACLSFRDSGASFVTLSGAPLAHSGHGTAERAVLERLPDQLGEGDESLERLSPRSTQFKKKSDDGTSRRTSASPTSERDAPALLSPHSRDLPSATLCIWRRPDSSAGGDGAPFLTHGGLVRSRSYV